MALEKRRIIPGIKSEIALDTPCPIIRNEELWLYYSAMDRTVMEYGKRPFNISS